jgi:hypothetical protein
MNPIHGYRVKPGMTGPWQPRYCESLRPSSIWYSK